MAFSLFGLIGCGSNQAAAEISLQDPSEAGTEHIVESPAEGEVPPPEPLENEVMPGEELLCLCETEKEAQDIADMYGIELVKFSYGVATFHADDPEQVIALGQEKGYPALELNGMMHTFGQ